MSSTKNRLAIFASGSGSNAEEILKHFAHHPTTEVVLLLSNNQDAFALTRATKFNVATHVFSKAMFNDTTVVLDWLRNKEVTHIVLAGFLLLVPPYLVKHFPGKIINIHPALLPKFGGKGMYGMRVHQSVKETGETETGITIHVVDEQYDEGKILYQETCSVLPSDSTEEIANKVHALEYYHYPRIIEQWIGK
jgi:phosphoribosylglycinamide formyltransferase 1